MLGNDWNAKRLLNNIYPVNNYLFRVNKRNAKKRFEMCSKLTTKTPEQRQQRYLPSRNNSSPNYNNNIPLKLSQWHINRPFLNLILFPYLLLSKWFGYLSTEKLSLQNFTWFLTSNATFSPLFKVSFVMFDHILIKFRKLKCLHRENKKPVFMKLRYLHCWFIPYPIEFILGFRKCLYSLVTKFLIKDMKDFTIKVYS